MTKLGTQMPNNTRSPGETSAAKSEDPDFKSWVNHPKTVARLQILVIALGILVIIGFATVIGRIAYLTLYQTDSEPGASVAASSQTQRMAVPPANVALEQPIELPPGAVVEDVQPMGDGTVMVRFKDTRGTGMMVFDAASGAVRRHWRFVPAAN